MDRQPATGTEQRKSTPCQSNLGFALSLVVVGVLLAALPWLWAAGHTIGEQGSALAGFLVTGFGVIGAGIELDKRWSKEKSDERG